MLFFLGFIVAKVIKVLIDIVRGAENPYKCFGQFIDSNDNLEPLNKMVKIINPLPPFRFSR